MQSVADETASSAKQPRLGQCEVCAQNAARYTCPKCEVKTCCFPCVQIHKKELNCNGIRDPTKFIPLREMSKLDFMSDYYFLEKCTRYAHDGKSERLKNFLTYNRHEMRYGNAARLCQMAAANKTRLMKLSRDFTRNKTNTTIYHHRLKTIFWRVEWTFANAGGNGGMLYVDERCDENKTIAQLLDKYLNVNSTEQVARKNELEYYQSVGVYNLKILLKAEGIKRCRSRFYVLDAAKTLKQNLAYKTIVEFPSIYLSYGAAADAFDVIDSDEDVEAETKEHELKLNELHKQQLQRAYSALEANNASTSETIENQPSEVVTSANSVSKKDKQKQKDAFYGGNCNFLISNEQQLELLNDSSSSDENETVAAAAGSATNTKQN